MAFNWNDLFGEDYFITLTDEERRYFGLDPIGSDREITRFYSKTNFSYRRTTVFWSGNEIVKVIEEDNRLLDGEKEPAARYIDEYDTLLKTEGRTVLLPLTDKGKPKPVTATNIRSVTPFGCRFSFGIVRSKSHRVYLSVFNPRNYYSLPIGEQDRIAQIEDEEGFHRFMDYYMQSCTADYFDRVNYMRTAKHQTVKYKTGDVFRVELDRFHCCYGVITGQVRKIRKWPELPSWHSLRNLMGVPIMTRYYDLITERRDMTARELKAYPLTRLITCFDNDIIWGAHKIVGHTAITAESIEFPLFCTAIRDPKPSPHDTVNTFDSMLVDGFIKKPVTYRMFVEWGTATVTLPYDQISEKLREYLEGNHSSSGVWLSVQPDFENKCFDSKQNLLSPQNREIREEIFRCIGLEADANFDDFAQKFGGLTKAEILQKDF